MRSTIQCGVLDVPHLARLSRLCRGRPPSCSRRLPATGSACVFFLSKSPFVRTGTYQSRHMYTRNIPSSGVAGRSLSVEGQWFRISDGAFFVCANFFFVGAMYVFSYQCKNMYDDD